MTSPPLSRLRTLADPDHLPALRPEYIRSQPALGLGPLDPAPRILLLYGSLRERSYSRLVVESRSTNSGRLCDEEIGGRKGEFHHDRGPSD